MISPLRWIGRCYKNGGSIAVLVPQELVQRMELKRGDYFGIEAIDESDAPIKPESPSLVRPTTRLVMRRLTTGMVLDRDV